MGLICIILLGATLGWMATIIRRTDGSQAFRLNVAVGIAGALLGGLVVGSLIGEGNLLEAGSSVRSLLVALAGSIVLLVSLNLLRPSQMR